MVTSVRGMMLVEAVCTRVVFSVQVVGSGEVPDQVGHWREEREACSHISSTGVREHDGTTARCRGCAACAGLQTAALRHAVLQSVHLLCSPGAQIIGDVLLHFIEFLGHA